MEFHQLGKGKSVEKKECAVEWSAFNEQRKARNVEKSRMIKVRGVLVFNETGNGQRREGECQQGVTPPSQLILLLR